MYLLQKSLHSSCTFSNSRRWMRSTCIALIICNVRREEREFRFSLIDADRLFAHASSVLRVATSRSQFYYKCVLNTRIYTEKKVSIKSKLVYLTNAFIVSYTQQFIIFLEEFNNFKFQQYYRLILIL